MAHRDAVPGTILLVETKANDHSHRDNIVLNPQPSNDPNDPLNWTQRRKLWNIGMVYVYVLGVGIATTVQYSVLTNISEETGISLADLNTGTGLMFLFAGWGCLFWQPLAITYGRRGIYIITSALCIAPMIWTVYTNSAGAWFAHRILIGFFVAPVESLPELTVPDLFFAHERGNYMGLYALFLFGSNSLAPFFAGFITNSMGWEAAIWFGTIVCAASTVIIFFGMEETIYFRNTLEGMQVPSDISPPTEREDKETKTADDIAVREASPTPDMEPSVVAPSGKWSRFKLFTLLKDRPTVAQTFTMMYRPLLAFFLFPNVVWAGFLYGSALCLYQVANATMALILGGEPYNFAPSMVGLSYVAVIIGSVLGWLWAGWVADKVAIRLARRNGGIREPEQRLWILIVAGLISATGLILWGVGAAHQLHFMVLIVGLTMVSFGVCCGGTAAISYDVDCFKEIAGETLILVMVIRNTMGFGMGYGITPWISASGLQNTFIATAFLSLACTYSFLFLIMWGKKLRKGSTKNYWKFADSMIVAGGH